MLMRNLRDPSALSLDMVSIKDSISRSISFLARAGDLRHSASFA
jgi:hypothetical protein